jgi:hypothetical protein
LPGVAPTVITWNMYATGGILVQTISDAITYSGIFEVSRIRSISI